MTQIDPTPPEISVNTPRSLLAQPIVGYLLFVAFSLYFLIGARGLTFGALAQIGPGFFPTVLALIFLAMALGGIALEWRSIRERGERADGRIDWRPLVFICLAILVFALLVRRLGLIPASVASAFVAGFAERPVRPARLVLIAAGIGALVWLIFIAGLDLSVAAFRMPL